MTVHSIHRLGRDARYAVRTLSRSPGFSATIVLVIALGIGATTTFFSLAYGVLVRPLPWPEPDRIVRLQESRAGRPGRVPWTISNTTYHAWRKDPSTIEELGGWTRSQSMTMTVGSGEPERVRVGRVTPSLLRVLGVSAIAGRLLDDDDVGGGGPGAVLLGFRIWQQRFGSAPEIIGRTLRLDDRPVIVAGIMPQGFTFPDRDTEAWLPMSVVRVEPGASVISVMIFNAMARLRDQSTPEQAASEATARALGAPKLGLAAVALFGGDGDPAVSAIRAREAMTGDVRPALIVLLIAVALLFCTALASVLVLQSVRSVRQQRELAVRAAIGASWRDLLWQSLAESTILSATGGFAGLLVAAALHQVLPALLPPDFPRAEDVRLDHTVGGFTILVTLLAGLASGFLPALQMRARTLVESLASDSAMPGAAAGGRHARRLRTVLMSAQVAIACVLLVGTALLARSFAALVSADRGFDPHDLLTAHVAAKPEPFATRAAALERVQARLRSLPGVAHVGFGNALPYVTSGGFRGFTLPSPADPGSKIQAQAVTRIVDPEYFAALRLRVVAGRALTQTDTASSRPVVVVNRTFAARYLPSDPLGRVLPFVSGSRREWEIVGIVDDVRQGGFSGVAPPVFGGLTDPPQPELFFPHTQWDLNVTELAFAVRTSDPAAVAPALRSILRDEDPSLAIDSIMTMQERVMNSLARPRTYAVLIGGFGLFALLVAAVGLYGTISYMTAQRTREIGVRAALGARPRDIFRLVTSDAVAIAVGGVALGLLAALLLARSLGSLIYGVSHRDPLSFLTVALLLLLVAATACAVPARRATRVSPLVALRTE